MPNFHLITDRLDSDLRQGKTASVILETEAIDKNTLSAQEIAELHAFRAWALYKQKQFDEARAEALLAEDTERGLRCLAAIENYLGNLERARYYLGKLPDTPAKDNLKMQGYLKDSAIPKEEVLRLAFKWVDGLIDPTNTAHLMSNAAQWLFFKAEGKEDLMLALGFMHSAFELYGTNLSNLRYRADAKYWISQIMEELFGPSAAATAAKESLKLWEIQLSLDPANPDLLDSHARAQNRVAELSKIRTSLI